MFERLNELWKDDCGATAVEYAIMSSLIAGVIVATVSILGTRVVALFAAANVGWP